GTAEAISLQDRIGFGGEVAIGIKEEFDALAQLVLTKEQGVGLRFYVSHVDLFSGTGIPLSGSDLSNIGAARGDILHLGARSMSVQPFDDRDGVIWYDGKFVDWRDANIHILTHAMHYASAVFEGERVYEGKVFRLTDHSERLVRSAELLGFK